MSAGELLVLFRIKNTVQVFFAELPANDVSSLSMRGPFDIPGAGISDEAGSPIFDYNRDQILWASISGEGQSFHTCRLDPHFSLVSSETITTDSDIRGPPFIILDGKTVTVAGGGRRANVAMFRRGQDNKWSTLDFKSTPKMDDVENVRATVVYKPSTNAPLKYIFAFRLGHGYLAIDTIRESSFNDLSRDDSIRWQHFQSTIGEFQLRKEAWAPIVIHDRTTRKNRLYIFTYINDRGFAYAFFPLRQDGSIDSYKQSIKAECSQLLSTSIITPNSKRVKVHESEGRLLLLVETGDKKNPVLCYTGYIQKNGLAPEKNDWKMVTLGFDMSEADRDVEAAFSSIITPGSYQ
ncbi:hypothetical protein FPHYL_2113 [Fusarium phyllophilum]|uniref:Uncharacterized protein n=1 Tax=Fusarium phyllophilum TaxID=47803 RepID=A0A8H5KB53_9HYPO|nr:hypothetical protein FPHYL_2113 [Fusarium phyllophilum]